VLNAKVFGLFKVTTDSKHSLPIAENVLDRQFAQTAPNHVWVGDITYMALALGHPVPTDEGWLYLAAVKDLYTCEIVGWAMDQLMTKQLAIDALRAAYWRKKPPPGLLHPSDRGSQYCSGTYRALQVSFKMKTSMALALGHPMSRKGDCWDNAPTGWPRAMESFFGTLKTACLHHFKFKTRDQARQWCLIISRCSTIEFGDMPRFKIRHPPTTRENSIKMNFKLLHN
jgi:putative transposase